MKIDDLIPESIKVRTSIGDLYVRQLTVWVVRKLSGVEDKSNLELGNEALKLLLSRDSDKSSRERLNDEEYLKLTEGDLEQVLPVVYGQCDFHPVEELCDVERFGALVREELMAFRKSSEKVFKSFSSVLRPDTISQYVDSMRGVNSITEKIRKSISSASTIGSLGSLGSLESKNAEVRSIGIPDFSNTPENRAAKATEKTAASLEEVSGLLLEMGGSIGTAVDSLMGKVVPEYLSSLDQSRVSAARTLKLTVFGLIFSALVSIGLTFWQVYLAKESGKEADIKTEQAIELLKLNLEAAQTSQNKIERELAFLRQENKELNNGLILALKAQSAQVINSNEARKKFSRRK